MRECLVLTPALFDLTQRLRDRAGRRFSHDGEKAELHVTETDNGLDLAFRWRAQADFRADGRAGQGFRAAMASPASPFNGEIVLEQAMPLVDLWRRAR